MVIEFETLEERRRRADASRCHSFVERVRRAVEAWEAGRIPLEALCAEAGDALQGYASETLTALLRTARPTSGDSLSQVLHAYNDAISRAGVAIRDAIPDASARHAVAQRLQVRMLLAEADFYDYVASIALLRSRA